MRWLGFIPLVLQAITIYWFVKIATIPVAYRTWYLGWGLLTLGPLVYLLWRSERMIELLWFEQLWGWARFWLETLSSGGMMLGALYIWKIVKPQTYTTPEPVAQIEMNWLGFITMWNDAAAELLGWVESEVLRQELAEVVIPGDLVITMPDGQTISARALHRQGLQRYRETGESSILNTKFDTVAQHKNGSRVAVTVIVSAHTNAGMTRFLGQLTRARQSMT